MGQTRPLFVYFRPFLNTIANNLIIKKRRWHSNPGRQDGRRRRIHWAMAVPTLTSYLTFILMHLSVRIRKIWVLIMSHQCLHNHAPGDMVCARPCPGEMGACGNAVSTWKGVVVVVSVEGGGLADLVPGPHWIDAMSFGLFWIKLWTINV